MFNWFKKKKSFFRVPYFRVEQKKCKAEQCYNLALVGGYCDIHTARPKTCKICQRHSEPMSHYCKMHKYLHYYHNTGARDDN